MVSVPGSPSDLRLRKPPRLATIIMACQSGRFYRDHRCLINEADKGFPFCVVKVDRAGQIGGFTTESGEMMDTPRHDHIDCQAVFQTSGCSQLPVLNTASAFEHTVVNFDAPSVWHNGQGRFLPPRKK